MISQRTPKEVRANNFISYAAFNRVKEGHYRDLASILMSKIGTLTPLDIPRHHTA
ncbi:hypothetical protein VCR29J2_980060 [Vibrio coralliirubri]|nr:hypothetical protein VCR29J2_980060 [Vibrio coralliirubri]